MQAARKGGRYFRIPMMNYDLNPQMILRVPRFPVNKAGCPPEEILLEPIFRDALYLASDVIFSELSRNDFQLSRCSEKMKHSLAKYQKRICYRPTPFGAFAGVAVLPFNQTNNDGIKIAGQSFQALVTSKEQAASGAKEQYFRVNPCLYEYGTDFRVLGKGEKGTFAISEIFGSAVVRGLASGHQIFSRENLAGLLRTNGVDTREIDWYITELVELQIILPHQTISRNFPSPLVQEHKENPGSAYDSYCSFSAAGSMPEGTRQKLNDAIYCLDKLNGKYEPGALTSFKDRFEKLFEKREVPLLQALDPELGIDYDGLSNSSLSTPGGNIPASIPWSPLHELLLGKWTMKQGRIPELTILDTELAELKTPEKNYPPGSSMMFSVPGDKLHIKAAGGASGLNMIGRFTVPDPAIQQLAKDVALKEMQSNPGVLFAELSHIDSPEVASVNKKAIVYDYQIPFFESPEVPDDFVISLSDLYISLAGNHLVLRSARLNRQVIPRFSSAYDYQRSTLPIFRFLCDLQHEGIDTNLNFSMARLFPGLPAYPRVSYKDIILEAASWHLDAKDLSGLKKLDDSHQFEAFHAFAAQIGLPEEFSYEVHDHLLHINLSSRQDVSLLLKTIPATGKIVLREYYKSQESLVEDDQGNSYTHECIAFLTNRTASYVSGITNALPSKHIPVEKDKLFPFDDWLYFRIYLHPAGYADLLVNYIQPFIAENVRKGNISLWFFISYYDDDFHLRVRLKQVPGRETHLLKTYKRLERKLRQLPNLKKLELSTYFKERERYAFIGVEAAEELFKLSSEIVLSELLRPDFISDPHKEKVFSGVRHLLIVCQSLGFSFTEIEELSKSFTGRLSKSEKIELDLEYREHKRELSNFLLRYQEKTVLENDYLDALRAAFESLQTDEKLRLVMDVNHMHLNRHYLIDQQVLEGKSYYFLGKVIRRHLRFRP